MRTRHRSRPSKFMEMPFNTNPIRLRTMTTRMTLTQCWKDILHQMHFIILSWTASSAMSRRGKWKFLPSKSALARRTNTVSHARMHCWRRRWKACQSQSWRCGTFLRKGGSANGRILLPSIGIWLMCSARSLRSGLNLAISATDAIWTGKKITQFVACVCSLHSL